MTINYEYEVLGIEGVPDYSVVEIRKKVNGVALIIPVLNEGHRIINQLGKMDGISEKVDLIIADGNSSDGSLEYFKSHSKELSTILIKRGTGGLSTQLRMAFHYCLEKEYEFLITMDGNDKDDSSGLDLILNELKNGYDFVQGSRFINGGVHRNTPFIRYFGIRFIHAPLTSIAALRWFTDSTNGYRGFSRRMLFDKKIGIFRDIFMNYELITFLPIAAGRLRYKVKEVPVSRIYPKDEPTPTKITGLKSYADLLKILFKSGIGSYFVK